MKKRKNGTKKEKVPSKLQFKKNMPANLCREFQLKSLLNWKTYPKETCVNQNECEYYEVDDVLNTNFDKYCKDLQCILINPPWSNKSPKFDFAKFVKIKRFNNFLEQIKTSNKIHERRINFRVGRT